MASELAGRGKRILETIELANLARKNDLAKYTAGQEEEMPEKMSDGTFSLAHMQK